MANTTDGQFDEVLVRDENGEFRMERVPRDAPAPLSPEPRPSPQPSQVARASGAPPKKPPTPMVGAPQPLLIDLSEPAPWELPSTVPPTARPVAPREHVPMSEPRPMQLTGPVEELAMSHDVWRRLGKSPEARNKKISDKVALLARDSEASRLAGVAAWYDSAVVHTYRAIAREAYEKGKTIADVIRGKGTGENTLTEEEFAAVAALNASLQP